MFVRSLVSKQIPVDKSYSPIYNYLRTWKQQVFPNQYSNQGYPPTIKLI